MEISFDIIHTPAKVVAETTLYKQYHFPEMLVMYDGSFITFKKMPSLSEFKEAQAYLRQFHSDHGQKHVKFYFPENEKVPTELEQELKDLGYELGFMELYCIEPGQFPDVLLDQDIDIQPVDEGNLEAFLDLNYQLSLEYGENFASQKKELLRKQMADPTYNPYFAFYKGEPAGHVHVILSDEVAEVDNLHVVDAYQKKGIGSRLQKAVMDQFPDRTVILIADGDDTPKEMYKKQGYQYQGFRCEALKVFK